MRKIINFTGHGLSETAKGQLKDYFKEDLKVVDLRVSLYRGKPLFPQITDLLKDIDFNNGEQAICVLPGLPIANSLVLSYIHGTSGMFPKAIELLRNPKSGVYEVSNIYDLENLRHQSRKYR